MEAKASKSALTWVVMTVTSLFVVVFLILDTVEVRDTLVHLLTKIVRLSGFFINRRVRRDRRGPADYETIKFLCVLCGEIFKLLYLSNFLLMEMDPPIG